MYPIAELADEDSDDDLPEIAMATARSDSLLCSPIVGGLEHDELMTVVSHRPPSVSVCVARASVRRIW